jgi:hypothetical protein
MRATLSQPPSFRTRRAAFPESSLSHARTLGNACISEPTLEFQDALPESLALYPRTKRDSASTCAGIRHPSYARRADTDAAARSLRSIANRLGVPTPMLYIALSGGTKLHRRIGVRVVRKNHATDLADRRLSGKPPSKRSDAVASRHARQEDDGARRATRAVRFACPADSRFRLQLTVGEHVQISSRRRSRDRRASSRRPRRRIHALSASGAVRAREMDGRCRRAQSSGRSSTLLA